MPDQFLRRYGQPEGNDEEQDQKARHDHVIATALQEGTDGDFIRDAARTGNGEERPDSQITDDREEKTVCRMDAACQFLQVLTARIAHGQDPGQRKADAGDDEAQDSPPDIRAGSLPHGSREDQVPCTKEQCEQHQANSNRSVSFIFSHMTLLLSF